MKKSCIWRCRELTDHKRITQKANSLKHWGGRRELNPQPSEPQSDALPIELLPPQITIIAIAESYSERWRRARPAPGSPPAGSKWSRGLILSLVSMEQPCAS